MTKDILVKGLVVYIWATTCGSIFAQPPEGNSDPTELTTLKESYKRRIEQTISPMQVQYIAQLDQLQKTYTRQNNLKAALAVQAELDQVKAEVAGKAKVSSTSGHFRIKARIDGSDKLLIRGNEMWFVHVEAGLPRDISIDGKKWNPAWDGNESKHFDALETVFRPQSKATVKVKKWKGRGSVAIEEYPSAENENTLVISIDDKEGAADEYEIAVMW